MTKFVVVKTFVDLEDEKHIYREGDKFPRSGRAKKERIEMLKNGDNTYGFFFIEEEKEEEKEKVEEEKTDK